MDNLMLFSNPEFGTIRVAEIDMRPWFVGTDVAQILGFKKINYALKKYVDEEDRVDVEFMHNGQIQEFTLINEFGLCSLVLHSKLPSAKSFKNWVNIEIPSSIIKYALSSVLESAKDLVKPENEETDTTGWKSVYVMLFDDKSVKIGISQDVRKRAYTLKSSSGKDIVNYIYSPLCSNPEEVESILHHEFEDRRIQGEWFSVDFEEAKDRMMEVFGENALFNEHDFSRINAFYDFIKYDFIGVPRIPSRNVVLA